MLHKDPPHPVTACIGPSKKRRVAGAESTSKVDLLTMDYPAKWVIPRLPPARTLHTI